MTRSPASRRRFTRRVRATATAAALLVLSVALFACGGSTPPASPGTDTPVDAAPASTAASAVTTPLPSPSPSAEPPLERPTKKDPLRIYFGGDSLSGMPAVMLAQLTRKNGLARVEPDYVESSRLTLDQPVDWAERVRQRMSGGRWDVGIFMIGANDSGMPMVAAGESVMYPKRAWLEEYERRVKRIATLMLRGGAERVYLVGMPVMPSASESEKMRGLNELFEHAAASSPDVVYVDSYDLLSTGDGEPKASLRSADGVHYTSEGAELVARAVWRAIERDWGGR